MVDASLWANLIAGLALTVSLIAAVFAWKSASEAKRANRIGIHGYQKAVYEAFLLVRQHLTQKGSISSQAEFLKFGPYVKTANIYLDKQLAARVSNFYDICLELHDLQTAISEAERLVGELTSVVKISNPNNPPKDGDITRARSSVGEQQGKLNARLAFASEMAKAVDALFIEKIKLV